MKKKKGLYSWNVLYEIITLCDCSVTKEYHCQIWKIDTIIIEGNKVTINYRVQHDIGTHLVVAMDSWGREYPNEPMQTAGIYKYEDKQISVDISLLNKAKYYEAIFYEIKEVWDNYYRIAFDCVIIDDRIYANAFDMPSPKYKSEEHKKIEREAYRHADEEVSKIEKKYKIKNGGNNLFTFLDNNLKRTILK